VRLCLCLLLLAPMVRANEVKPEFRWKMPVRSSNVCSIPLLQPPRSHNYAKNFDRMAIPSPHSLDQNQIPPPAPPCDMRRDYSKPKMVPKPRVPKPQK
jgi:hypothetical protein